MKNFMKSRAFFLRLYWTALKISLFQEIQYIDEFLINYRRHNNIETMIIRSILQKLEQG